MRRIRVVRSSTVFFVSVLLLRSALAQESAASLVPSTSDGHAMATSAVMVDGKPVPAWQTSAQEPTLAFKVAGPAVDVFRYLKITYLDRGYGRLAVTFKDAAGHWVIPDKSTNLVLLGTGRPVSSYQRCAGPFPAGFEWRVKIEKERPEPLCVLGAAVRSTPFADPHFQYLLGEAWKKPYVGPSAPGIDNRTLKGRVMVGYQGWFRTPNDPYNVGWRHWGDMSKAAFSTDMWPDVTQYPANCLDKAADVKTRSGKTAYLFSSGWPEVVRTHFAWMRQHGIDGAFVQRFISHKENVYSIGGGPEWVLGNVREAANQEGRIWAVEYDVSGCPDDQLLDIIRTDWSWMVDHFGVRQDRSYAHEGDKPVVFVWGMSLPSRHISVRTAEAVVAFLKNDPRYGGNYVIGGLPGNWRTLDASWQAHIAHYDCAQAWQSTDYAADQVALRNLGVAYYAMAHPGFSWANLKHLPTGSTEAFDPRAGGQFYQTELAKAVAARADHLFIGMFDEYDEGTAIMPMSDDPPPTNRQPGANAKFFPNLHWEGNPDDHRLPQVDLVLDGTPPTKNVAGVHFTARFSGQIVAPVRGDYVFAVVGPEGDTASLWIGDKHVDIGRPAAPDAPRLTLTLDVGEPVIYKLDYRHEEAAGRLQLRWITPGGTMQPVPASAFVDAWGRFITNEGKPADWWLTLTGQWRAAMRKANHATDEP